MGARQKRAVREQLFAIQNGCCGRCDEPMLLEHPLSHIEQYVPANLAAIKQIGANTAYLCCYTCPRPPIRTKDEIYKMVVGKVVKNKGTWTKEMILAKRQDIRENLWPPAFLKVAL